MSCGTIDGTGLIKSVWMSGIESPLGNPALSSVVGEWVFFELGSWRGQAAATPVRCHIAILLQSKRATNPCRKRSFCPVLVPPHGGLFRPLQGSGALLYAARCEQVSPIPR